MAMKYHSNWLLALICKALKAIQLIALAARVVREAEWLLVARHHPTHTRCTTCVYTGIPSTMLSGNVSPSDRLTYSDGSASGMA